MSRLPLFWLVISLGCKPGLPDLKDVTAWEAHVENLNTLLRHRDDCDDLDELIGRYREQRRTQLERLLARPKPKPKSPPPTLLEILDDSSPSTTSWSQSQARQVRALQAMAKKLDMDHELLSAITQRCLGPQQRHPHLRRVVSLLSQLRLADPRFYCEGQMHITFATKDDVNVHLPAKLDLPTTVSTVAPVGTVPILATPEMIAVDGKPLVRMRGGKVAANLLEGGYLITPLYERLSEIEERVDALAVRQRHDCVPAIALYLDCDVRFSLLAQIMYSAGQAAFPDFALVGRRENGSPGAAHIFVPQIGYHVGPLKEHPPVHLTVTIRERALHLASSRHHPGDEACLGLGCAMRRSEGGREVGTRFPVKEDGCSRADCYELSALGERLAALKKEFPHEYRIIVAAEPQVTVDVLFAVMETARERGGEVLFPEQALSPGL